MSLLSSVPTNPQVPAGAFSYSVLRVVPDAVRGEFFNVGLAMVDHEGDYSRLAFNYHVQTRLTQLGGRHLSDALFRTFGELSAAYDTVGQQLMPALRTKPPITLRLLDEWARENASLIRLSAPRVTLAEDADMAFARLFLRHVRAPVNQESRRVSAEGERARIRDTFIRELTKLPNFDRERIQVSAPIRGLKAHHWVDIAVVGHQVATAFAHALPMRAANEREVFLHRGTILETARDLAEDAPRIALFSDPAADRKDLLRETQRVLEAEAVQMVAQHNLMGAVSLFDEPLLRAD